LGGPATVDQLHRDRGRYTPSLPLAIALARFFERPVEEVFHVDGTA
jgi:DNA-binding XRE family transcriptional regulator